MTRFDDEAAGAAPATVMALEQQRPGTADAADRITFSRAEGFNEGLTRVSSTKAAKPGIGDYTISWEDSLQGSAKTNFSCVVGSEMYEDVDPGICTVGLLPDAHEMRVRTYAPNGEPADRPFHLAVFRD